MKLYAITRITEGHFTWMDVFGVTPNKKVADKKVQELREAGRYGDWVVQEFESNDVKNITGVKKFILLLSTTPFVRMKDGFDRSRRLAT